MKRFFGMMPSDEIEMEETYKDDMDHSIVVQAGKNGWTLLYADGSSEFKDVETETAKENFDIALNHLKSKLTIVD